MSIAPLREFVCSMTRLVESRGNDEHDALEPARDLLAGLVSNDDWLPDAFAEPDPAKYRQYLFYGDPMDRFSLVSFVWGPGQRTPVHDHLMWGWECCGARKWPSRILAWTDGWSRARPGA